MSRIDELIGKHCPNGVKCKTIDECIVLNFGTRITKAKDSGTKYPVYGGGGESFRTDDYNRENEYVVSRFAMSEKCVRWVDGKFWMLDSGFTFDPVSPEIDKKYVAYNLLNMQPKIYSCTSQGAQRNLKVDAFKRFEIPIPPIEVQQEIVRILDAMCELETKLQEELEAREKQLETYRNVLLSEADEASYKNLSEVASIVRGVRVTKKQLEGNCCGYPVFQNSLTSMGFFEESNFPAGTAFVIGAGAAGQVGFSEKDFWAADDCYCLKCSEVLSSKYAYHALLDNQQKLLSQVRKASVPRLSRKVIESLDIPVPPIETQREIVAKIDAFEALIRNLRNEIEHRHKQYEHYRDTLLTFEKKGA